jgi:hypothetical protein
MKVGFILECQLGGCDAIIYKSIAQKLCAKLQIEKPETLINKKRVIDEGPSVAQTLIDDINCDYVFFIWDRKPRWKDDLGNCNTDTVTLTAELTRLGVNLAKIKFACIDEELESWLIADARGFNAWIQSKTTHALTLLTDNKTRAEQSSPKDRIRNYLRTNYGKWNYNDTKDNVEIFNCLPSLDRARNWNPSFNSLCQAIEQICLE